MTVGTNLKNFISLHTPSKFTFYDITYLIHKSSKPRTCFIKIVAKTNLGVFCLGLCYINTFLSNIQMDEPHPMNRKWTF